MMFLIVGLWSLILPSIFCDCNLEPPLCTTDTCKLLANEIFIQMNLTADVEADPKAFYCNHGGQSTGIYSPRWRYLLTRALSEKQEGPKILESAQKLYKSCSDLDQRDKRGFSTLLKFFDEIGGFPMIDQNWNENSFDVNKAIAILLAKHGIETFVKLVAWKDTLSIKPVYNWIWDRKRTLTEVVQLLNKDTSKDIQESLTKAFEFSNVLRSSQVGSFQNSLTTTIGNFSAQPLTYLNWNKVLQQISSMTGVAVNKGTKLYVEKPRYFMETLSELLEKTPKMVIANYFGLHLIYNYYMHLTSELVKIARKPSGNLRSYISSQCLETIYFDLDPMPEKLFTDKFVSRESRKELETAFNLIKVGLLDFIPKLTFMDNETIERASKNAQQIKLAIGADDDFSSEETLNAKISIEYPGIEQMTGNDLLQDIATMKSAKVKNELFKLFREEAKYSARLNGFDSSSNTLVLRSYSLQNPSYIAGAPFVYNLGTIGNYMANHILMQVATADGIYYENGQYQRVFTDQAAINYKRFDKSHDYNALSSITADFFPILYKQYLNFVENSNVTNTRLPGPLKSYGLSANYIMSYAHAKCLSPWMLNEDTKLLLRRYTKEMMQKC